MGDVTELSESGLELVRAVDAVDWAPYAMAPSERWYSPEHVPAAFRRLLVVSSMEGGQAAYNQMLFAVGNNHAGCIYPAAAGGTAARAHRSGKVGVVPVGNHRNTDRVPVVRRRPC
jgi:hypothetical protein